MNAPLAAVSLEDKYALASGRVYLSGVQALARLLIMQRLRDQAAGLNTGGFVSGYRGSPLGGLDKALWEARTWLEAHHVRFQPGVNEDLAATAVWGTQQLNLIGPARYDGVFAMWYGKGPGVDRCGDVFKHANHFGTARHGGVLLVAGDDHAAYSSTLAHQSDHMFAACMVPVLYPCNVQEVLDLGLHGWAMSRYSGCLIGFKTISDTAESSASVDGDPFRIETRLPHDFPLPPGGLNGRLRTGGVRQQALAQEALMQDYKVYAALAYARANHLNRTVIDAPDARLGIIASGKSYLDVREALEELGIDEREAARIGIRVFKVAMPWPLEPEGVREFARGLEEILVVEEKRQVVEYQLKEQLYNWREDVRPRVIGKFDEKGEWAGARGDWLLPSRADFTVAQVARVIAGRIARFHQSDRIDARLAFLAAKEAVLTKTVATPPRPAYYCSGCPHNTSTRTPEGSLALAGIGCHTMATAIYPDSNKTITHMGGEGATWIGQAPFATTAHVFVNMGDGTYFHSGYLALRAAVAAGVNVTYKILYNDAVAMTGGQAVDGALSVASVARQAAAEGVRRLAVVTEDTGRYRDRSALPDFATVHDRRDLDAVQRELREYRGVSVLIYDQVCAAEKRRRRKRGELPDPPRRVFINEAVCEGCGDCGTQSNCTSILPLETELGRKRAIDQSACNKDYSCLKGFCPSFVTVEGATPRRARVSESASEAFAALPEPPAPGLERPCNILVTGIGGTGVLTIGALMGMAAHLEGKQVSVLDMTGLSQKNGAVMSHIRLGGPSQPIHAQAIATGEADLILGCDMLTAGAPEAIAKTRPGRTTAVVNTHEQPIGSFAQDRDWQYPAAQVRALMGEAVGERTHWVDATRLAAALLGDAITSNVFVLGYAFQLGLVPLSAAALERAIELNRVAVEANKQAFLWGRRAAVDTAAVERAAFPAKQVVVPLPQTLERLIQRRVALLTGYQNAAYAAQFERFVREVQAAEQRLGAGERLTRAVAQNLYQLMAYKDEYEVARLYTDGELRRRLEQTFEGPLRLRFHLAPPVLARRDAAGRLLKREFGPWIWRAFGLLARLRFLRGTAFDPFGYTAERRSERRLIDEYRGDMRAIVARLTPERLERAVEFARLPEQIRGFGHVKQKNLEGARARAAALKSELLGAANPGVRRPLDAAGAR